MHLPALVDRREVIFLALLLAVSCVYFPVVALQATVNLIAPCFLLAVLGLGSVWHIRRDKRAIWTPLFWFRISSGVYFGLGQIAPYIVNDVTRRYIDTLYSFGDDEAFKVGLINTACVLIVLVIVMVAERIPWRRHADQGDSYQVAMAPQSRTIFYAAIFLIVGGLARYFVVLPASLGLVESPPGIVNPISKSYVVGIFLCTLLALRGNKSSLLIVAILAPIDLAVGFLTFAKVEVLLTLLFLALAFLHDRLTIWRIVAGVVSVVGVFSQLDPYIHFGRNEIDKYYGDTGVSLQQRFDIISRFDGVVTGDPQFTERQTALNRISYLNAAAMVVGRYDTGNGGNSLKNALSVLVPRVIWPEKPSITAVGEELYVQATSQEGSSISPGLFAEGYWNYGWIGLPLLMVPLGLVLFVFSRYSLAVMGREAWAHMPVVLLGVYMGTRVDGWFVADIIGGGSIAFITAMVLGQLERIWAPSR